MPTPVSARPGRRPARANAAVEPAPARADVVAVHRPGEDPVGRRIEAVDELAALVVEVADDRRPAVGLDASARSARRSRPRCGRWSSPAARASASPSRPSRSMSSTWRWFQAMAIGPVAAGAAIGMTWSHRRGPLRGRPRGRPSRRAIRRRRGPAARCRARRAGATGRAPGRASRPPGSAAPYGRPVRGSIEVGPVVP